ncbi:hypothetical protein C8R46DRAFT_655822 [Mycena filopes]|nr:hypothetical protein C8R46DRAFT_655822 [Mycena filopes]
MDDHPLFPLDLEREIFETTAELHPEARTTLLRVARRVLVWIEPLLYQVVRVEHWVPEGEGVVPALLKKPAQFCRLAVRHLLLDAPGEKSLTVLKLCSSVTDLAFGISYHPDPSILPILAEMRLQRLTIEIKALGGDLTHAAFSSLTHLAIVGHQWAPILEQIPTLTALTHLTVFVDISQDVIHPDLANSPGLRLFMVLFFDDPVRADVYDRAKTLHGCDPRFVIALYNDYWSTWRPARRGWAMITGHGAMSFSRKNDGGRLKPDVTG